MAKFAISDEKRRYLVHLSTLIQRNYKVNEEVMDQENGLENEEDIGLFDDDQAGEDDIIILENDEAHCSVMTSYLLVGYRADRKIPDKRKSKGASKKRESYWYQ